MDLFGTLRGACARTGCRAWCRDVGSMKHWSDTSVLSCSDCGGSNAEHDDCGPYQVANPPPPAALGGVAALKLVNGVLM